MRMDVTDKITVTSQGKIGNDSIFENSQMLFKIHAPIFVMRDLSNSRFNVTLGDYGSIDDIIEPLFYSPNKDRGIVKIDGEYITGDMSDNLAIQTSLAQAYEVSWTIYKGLVDKGYTQEIARMALPLSIYVTSYLTMSVQSLAAFRITEDSLPEAKIVYDIIMAHFREDFPLTYSAYFSKQGDDNG